MEFVSDRADGTYHASLEVLLWLLVWYTKPKHLHQQPVLAREALNWKSWHINHTSPSADAAGGVLTPAGSWWVMPQTAAPRCVKACLPEL